MLLRDFGFEMRLYKIFNPALKLRFLIEWFERIYVYEEFTIIN